MSQVQCSSIQINGNALQAGATLLFTGKCETARTWVVRTFLGDGLNTSIGVSGVSYQIREIGPGGGGVVYTRRMNRVGDVLILRGSDVSVSIAPGSTTAGVFTVSCTCDVSESPSTTVEQWVAGPSTGTLAAAGGAQILTLAPFTARVHLGAINNNGPLDYTFVTDAGANITNNIATNPATGEFNLVVPQTAAAIRITNNNATLTNGVTTTFLVQV